MPSKIDDWVIEENHEEYADRFAVDRLPKENAGQARKLARRQAKLPQIATALDYSLGCSIHEQLEYEIRDLAL